ADADADQRAETRPGRLDVAHALEVLADGAATPAGFIGRELVIGAPCRNGRSSMLGSLHARQYGVVRSLDARHVDEAGSTADQRAAREGQLRHRLPATLGYGARAIRDALGILERALDRRVCLEALKFLE